MDPSKFLRFLLISSFLLHLSHAESVDDANSVLFIDSNTHQYFRRNALTNPLSVKEVGAAVSVLLGLTPADVSAASSAKLNQLLQPNPFERPRHVLMLEISLAQGFEAMVHADNGVFSSGIKGKVIRNAGSAKIELPGGEGASYFSVTEPEFGSELPISDKELSDFASSSGGSYVSDSLEPSNGELILPLSGGSQLSLQLSKEADRKFATSLIRLVDSIRKAMDVNSNVAELVGGFFDGIKALQEEYGSENIVHGGMELLLATVSKAFDSLQANHKGEAVAVILFSEALSSQPQKMLDVTIASRPTFRWLEEVKAKFSSNSTTVMEVALVRITLAWVTGIILIIATIIGVYMLLNMQVTKDTLLYCNVKLD